ncbi:MAG: tRNA (adenosine(37)-N6)-dimethylallyltransferase MiaA [Clostridia bacterium]|nr:tRNA (adenosine(37)-N6)-dimethylallyltransferase MiaA [Clostridia bacterium]
MKLLVICGATASGKSDLAVECAKRLNGEIISCDAFLVYRDLNIGTAKPTKEEMQGIPHYMIDVASPLEKFSVSDFERMALPILNDILSRNKTPVLCGGTGFYMNALLYAQSFGNAPASQEVRKKYEGILEEKGREYLHGLLREVDPESAEVLHVNDTVRVVRALEIYELTGKKKSEQNDKRIPRYPFVSFAFDYPREELYARIERRVDRMIEAGLVEEVKGLLQSGVPAEAQCMQGIGYKEVVESLKNNELQSTMSDVIKKNTRNYAKRQLTFFKRTENLHWLKPTDIPSAAEEIVRIHES